MQLTAAEQPLANMREVLTEGGENATRIFAIYGHEYAFT